MKINISETIKTTGKVRKTPKNTKRTKPKKINL
jgi:hypothetical protein